MGGWHGDNKCKHIIYERVECLQVEDAISTAARLTIQCSGSKPDI